MKNKSGLIITNDFKIVLGEGTQGGSESQKPEKLWIERGIGFYNKIFKSLLKEYETELYSTYSDLKAVFIEMFNRTLLRIINNPRFVNGDVNWKHILKDAVITYNNKIHSTNKMTPVDASNNPDKVKYYVNSTKNKSKFKVGADKRNIFPKGHISNWNREFFEVSEVQKTQPPTYKIGDMNGEIIEDKYYEQDLLKFEFDFGSNIKVLDSLDINLSVDKNNDDKK